MERMAWTDERLDDLARRMDAGFERVDGDIRELRTEVRVQGTELRGEIAGLGTALRGEIDGLRITLLRVGGAMVAGLVGVIAAVLLGG
ncbi:MAG: hypothetical protein WD649_03285 [Thermoleophilaceae bacterium]